MPPPVAGSASISTMVDACRDGYARLATPDRFGSKERILGDALERKRARPAQAALFLRNEAVVNTKTLRKSCSVKSQWFGGAPTARY